MPNFFTDNEDILDYLDHVDLRTLVALQERGFVEADQYDYAPADYEDAMDNYRRVLDMLGKLCGDFVAPRAADVDKEGAHYDDGVVTYAKGTQEALDQFCEADLMGFTLPRQYGGLNMPVLLYTMAIEMVSRADASLMNLFGLQDIAETILAFADDPIKDKYLPMFASGEVTGAMVLTEPDAGSDLGNVQLRAIHDEATDTWRLRGVKRFITNGCAQVLLVLARSEEGSEGARGLSLLDLRGRPHGAHPPHRGQDGHPRIAHLRDPVQRHPRPARRQPPARPLHLRDVPDERRPPGHRQSRASASRRRPSRRRWSTRPTASSSASPSASSPPCAGSWATCT